MEEIGRWVEMVEEMVEMAEERRGREDRRRDGGSRRALGCWWWLLADSRKTAGAMGWLQYGLSTGLYVLYVRSSTVLRNNGARGPEQSARACQ